MFRFFLPAFILVHLSLLYLTRFTLWPEMVVYPYLLNNGFKLYTDIINPYTPVFIYALSVFEKIFGANPMPYKILTWAIVIAIDITVFAVSKKLSKSVNSALLSLAFFIVLSIPFGINGLWFDLVQTPLVVASIYFFYRFQNNPKEKNSLLISTALLTAAIFIKQQALWLGAFYAISLIVNFKSKFPKMVLENYKVLILPVFISALHLLIFAKTGQLNDFLYWAVYFPLLKASSLQGYQFLPTLKQLLIVALLFLAFVPHLLSRKNDQKFFIAASASLLFFAYPRFDYFHLIPSLATLSLALPKNLQLTEKPQISKALVLLSLLLLVVFSTKYVLRNLDREVRFFESEIFQVSQKVAQDTDQSDRVYIQNGPDQVLALANRLPPKPWADEFPWYLEIPGIQKQVLVGIQRENPKVIIFKPYESGSEFQIGAYRPQGIAQYIEQRYKKSTQITPSFYLKTQ